MKDEIILKVKNKKDKHMEKIMQEFINHEYEENKHFIEALVGARFTIESLWGIKTPDNIWERIMQAHIQDSIV